jgi:hypothetical protein
VSTYQELAELLVAEANSLLDELDGRGEALPTRERKLLKACGHLHRAAELVLELDPSDSLSAAVRSLSDLCCCGHDQGDHETKTPYRCEPYYHNECDCPGYAPASDDDLGTLPDFMTEPPTAAPTTPPEVA